MEPHNRKDSSIFQNLCIIAVTIKGLKNTPIISEILPVTNPGYSDFKKVSFNSHKTNRPKLK